MTAHVLLADFSCLVNGPVTSQVCYVSAGG